MGKIPLVVEGDSHIIINIAQTPSRIPHVPSFQKLVMGEQVKFPKEDPHRRGIFPTNARQVGREQGGRCHG